MSRYLAAFVAALRHTRLRLAAEAVVMVGVLAFGVVIAPAAAAPPAGTLNVEVVNPSESPVPVTGSVAAQVSGSVAVNNLPSSQTVNGTVSLDRTDASHLANVDSALSQLNVDESGNLKVSQPQASLLTFGNSIHLVSPGGLYLVSPTEGLPTHMTSLSVFTDQSLNVRFYTTTSSTAYFIHLPAGGSLNQSFPNPIGPMEYVGFYCQLAGPCNVTFGIAGY